MQEGKENTKEGEAGTAAESEETAVESKEAKPVWRCYFTSGNSDSNGLDSRDGTNSSSGERGNNHSCNRSKSRGRQQY